MDVVEFLRATEPKAQVSKLEKYLTEIRRLRDAGMTLQQVLVFLAENGVVISQASLSRFLKKKQSVQTSPRLVFVEGDSDPTRPPGMTDAGWREMLIANSKRRKP